MWRCVLIFLLFCLSCQSNNGKSQDYDLPEVSSESVGNTRIGLFGAYKKNNLILVNQSNERYLQPQEFVEIKNRKEIPLTSLKYIRENKPFEDSTAIVILEDDVMAKILAVCLKERLEQNSESVSQEEWNGTNWPERDAIFLEREGQRWVLVREEKLIDSNQRPTQKSKIYSTIKYCILQAQMTGHRPMHVLPNTDGSEIFRSSQNRLNQDKKKWKK